MCTTTRARRPLWPAFVGRIVLRVVAPVVLVVLALPSVEARAESTPVPVHVVVEARPGCTNEDGFWSEVTSRTNELRRVPAAGETPVLLVRAWEADGVVRGELSLRTARGEALPPRRVVGRTCQEVTSALALALVLAMEEGALVRDPPHPSREPEREPEHERAPEHEAEPAAPSAPPPPSRALPPSRVEPPPRVAVAMGAHGVLLSAGGLATGAGVFTELRSPLLDGRISGRLEAVWWGRTVSRAEGDADLSWLFLRAEVCLAPVATLALSLCALADGGAFSAKATHVRDPQSYSAPWFGAGASANAAWNWSPWVGIEAEVGVLAPIVRDDLVLRPDALLFRTPAVMTWLGIGPVIHFD